MATVKITDLPIISTINANTANSVLVGVDIPTNITGQITLTTLATGLYSNNNLVVGNNYTLLPNVVGQFTGNSASYIQVNIENQTSTGSGDFVVTADDGSDTDHYIDMGLNGSAYSDPTYSALKAHDGYLYIASSGAGKGNLAIGTTNSTGRVKFVVGGLETGNIVGYVDNTGIWSNSINSLITANSASANSVINSRISANVATLRGEITANATSANSVINTRITANIATANLFTQAAFDKANNALANTSGTFGGNLTVSGNLVIFGASSSVTSGNLIIQGTSNLAGNVTINAATYLTGAVTINSTMVLANSNFNATEAALTITASGTTATPANDGYLIHLSGKNGVPSRVVTDSYGTGAYSVFAGRAARGTVTVPTALQANDVIARYSSSGYGTTKYQSLGVGRIDFVAAENFTDANTGSRIEFYNCPIGSNTLSKIATFNGDSVHFTGVIAPEKGFIYTPRILTGAQTAITINFATDSMIRATFSSTLTMSFSNYTYGKVVEVWVTNTAGNNQSINLGALANNSTTGATTLTVASQRSAKLQYFSIDGDLANTFVAVTYG